MSLLLEALKRAERQRQPLEPPPPPADERDIAPPPAAPEPEQRAPFPELAMTLEPLAEKEPPPPPADIHAPTVSPEPPPPHEEEEPKGEQSTALEFTLSETPAIPALEPLPPPALPAPEETEPVPEATAPDCEPQTQLHTPPPVPDPAPSPNAAPEPATEPNSPGEQRQPSPLATPEQQERVRVLLGATGGNRRPSPVRKRQLILGGIALAVAAATAGALFWLDQQLSPGPAAQAGATHASSMEQPPLPPPADPRSPDSEASDKASPLPVENGIAAQSGRPEHASPPSAGRPAPGSRAESPSPGAAPVAIRRDNQMIVVHPATEAGYAAMANGNLSAAREHYQQALKSDQRSRDALLGLAVTALREGRSEEAARRYDQILALDPRDADANAGQALLRGAMDPVAYESKLKVLIEERGDNAALHHALGSLLARQHRWGEAQEAFFRAVTLAPRSADYLFNLAVALDYLGQYAQARTYYRKALDSAAPGSATFSRDAVQARLTAIEALDP